MTTKATTTDDDPSGVLPWTPNDPEQALEARQKLQTWPLDEHNAALLNEVHPRGYDTSLSDSDTPPHVRSFLLVSKILSLLE